MAALDYMVNSGNVTLVATIAKTVLQVAAPLNQRLRVKGFSVTVAGTAPVDLTIRVLRQTTSGTGQSIAPVKLEPAAVETAQAVAARDFSTEPTGGEVLQYKLLQGSYEKIMPLGQEFIVPGGSRLGIECTCAAPAVVAAECLFEE